MNMIIITFYLIGYIQQLILHKTCSLIFVLLEIINFGYTACEFNHVVYF